MRRLFPLLLLLALPASARASWAHTSVEELVRETDLIVVGTLRDVSEHTADEVDYGRGRIEVREVIWGNVSPGDSLLLKWSNPSRLACPRVEHDSNTDEGIWLLTRDGEAVAANYPGRFVELSERREVEAALAGSPVVLRTAGYLVAPGEPLSFTVVYRNTSKTSRSFPGVAFGGGQLRLAAGSRLDVIVCDDEVTSRAAFAGGAVLQDRSLAPVTVGPRGEHRVEVVLSDLLKRTLKEGEYYTVRLKLAGRRATNDAAFYIGKSDSPKPEAEPPPSATPNCVYTLTEPPRGLAPFTRAGLTALVALLLFPIFYRLRAALSEARLARVAHGVQTWQI